MLSLKIPEPLLPFLEKRKRFKIAYGGRGGGKSMGFAGLLSMKVSTEGALVGCFREFQNSIEDSVHSLLKKTIFDLGVPGFSVQKSFIDHRNGGGFRFRGLARSIEAIKSMHGFSYFWLEEGQYISELGLRTLTPTLREEDSELWVSANAMNSADPFSQRFIVPYMSSLETQGFYEDDLHYIVKMNYDDNPWFPDSLEQERQHDYKYLPRALYDHIWRGAFNDSVQDCIVLSEWFDASVDAHKKLGFDPKGAVVVSHDPSDLGTDDKAICKRQGSVILDAKTRNFGDVNEGVDWATQYAVENGADLFVWDSDGMGISLKRQVRETFKGKKIDFRGFRGSKAPENPETLYDGRDGNFKPRMNRDVFKNRRAQYYWKLRDRFHNTYLAVTKNKYTDPDEMISISGDIENLHLLRSEVCRIPRKFNNSGLIQVMSKPEMKRMKIQSPNLADSLMMSLMAPEEMSDAKPMNFTSFWS